MPLGIGPQAIIWLLGKDFEKKLQRLPEESRWEALQAYYVLQDAAYEGQQQRETFPRPECISPVPVPEELGEMTTATNAAVMLDLSPARVRQLLESGELMGIKPKGRWQVSMDSVRELQILQAMRHAA